jgi:hypothetical protein
MTTTIKVNSWLYKLLFALPVWLPYSIQPARVGHDCFSYVLITWSKPK